MLLELSKSKYDVRPAIGFSGDDSLTGLGYAGWEDMMKQLLTHACTCQSFYGHSWSPDAE